MDDGHSELCKHAQLLVIAHAASLSLIRWDLAQAFPELTAARMRASEIAMPKIDVCVLTLSASGTAYT